MVQARAHFRECRGIVHLIDCYVSNSVDVDEEDLVMNYMPTTLAKPISDAELTAKEADHRVVPEALVRRIACWKNVT